MRSSGKSCCAAAGSAAAAITTNAAADFRFNAPIMESLRVFATQAWIVAHPNRFIAPTANPGDSGDGLGRIRHGAILTL